MVWFLFADPGRGASYTRGGLFRLHAGLENLRDLQDQGSIRPVRQCWVLEDTELRPIAMIALKLHRPKSFDLAEQELGPSVHVPCACHFDDETLLTKNGHLLQ